MANMDIFNSDGFSLISLQGTVDKVDYQPNYLAQFFTKSSTSSMNFWLDRKSSTLDLVSSSAIGSAPVERVTDPRNMVNLSAVRLAKGRTVTAAEVANLRAFGSESEQSQVMRVYDEYRSKVRADLEATLELHRLGALQGKLFDADGRLIYNYFTQFAETESAIQNWNLTSGTFDPRDAASKLMRSLLRKAKGLYGENGRPIQVVILAGDDWFDALLANQKLQSSYLNISMESSGVLRMNGAFQEFTGLAGLRIVNYRGTDDNQEIAIAAKSAFAFVDGVGAMQHAVTPCPEFIPYIGSFGQEFYAMNIRDRDRDAWVRYEEYTYPLMFNKRPETTQRLSMT